MSLLVAKTDSAIAVTDSLTTLIDWTCIDRMSGFTIIIANAGGGSANDITDVQLDTSSDGGTTPALDQHAGVPAVPIASGAASQGTFTETAKYIRVRAVCAAEEDTTATAILTADSITGGICLLADVKDRLGLSGTDYDSVVDRIIVSAEALFNNYTRRTLIAPAGDVTEYHTGAGPRIQLNNYPVISITSITEALDYAFDSATALTADTDYRLIASGYYGIIQRLWCNWFNIADSIRVVYRAGYAAAGAAPAAGEIALPNDLREAAIEQASFIFKRRSDIGLSSVGFDGGNINKFAAMKLLPIVEATLKTYRRSHL